MTRSLVLLLVLLGGNACILSQEMTGIHYLNERPPDSTPVIFAPGRISSQYTEHSSPEFSKDGKEVYWTVVKGMPGSEAEIYYMRYREDRWSDPEKVVFLRGKDDMYPVFGFDFERLYFSSSAENQGTDMQKGRGIWYAGKTGKGFSDPVFVGFDSLDIYGLFVAKSGNLYFMARNLAGTDSYDLYVSFFKNGKHNRPEKLPAPVNSVYYEDNPFLTEDEQTIIFESNRPGGFGGMDLYYSRKSPGGQWTVPVNLGNMINSKYSERFPKISPDGKYFFFGSNRNAKANPNDFDIYWIRASCLYEQIPPKQMDVPK